MAEAVPAEASSEAPVVDPALIEAVEQLRKGATMLKAGRSGKPHFRNFKLSLDLTKLEWTSPKKKMGEASVELSIVKAVQLGQKTAVFKSNPIPEHEALSFSLIYADRSLDIVCKDKKEFQDWTTGLNALLEGKVTLDMLPEAVDGNVQSENLTVAFKGKTTVVVKREDASDMYTWGEGSKGCLGHGDEEDRPTPQVVEALLGKDIRSISCGLSHTAALSPGGEVYTWGAGGSGRLGQGHERDRVTPLMVDGLRGIKVVDIVCGDYHTVALSDAGEVYTWGKGSDLRLGYACTKQLTPKKVEGLSDIVSIACGSATSAAINSKGELYTWGSGRKGILGHASPSDSATPALVEGLTGVKQVSLGTTHAGAITENHEMWTWGDGTGGRLGHGDDTSHSTPKLVLLKKIKITQVSCGDVHTCCIDTNGNVYSFGDGGNTGCLGLGNVTCVKVPTQVKVLAGKKGQLVVCATSFTALLTTEGHILTWGLGLNGRLGHGDQQSRSTPTVVESMLDKKLRLVAMGGMHVAVTVIHGWVPDDEATQCMACKAEFTFVRRRHHCRNCGGVFCGNCSSKKYPLLKQGFSEPVRVCDKCYQILALAK